MFPFQPTALALTMVIVAALVVGVSKTSVGGLGTIAVALFAHVMDAKESTAAVLLLLITGDVVAVLTYRKHADWAMLRRLLPAVIPGIVLGAVFLKLVPTHTMKLVIGVILMVLLVLQILPRLRRTPANADAAPLPRGAAVSTGIAAGFTTMTANAAGPVMSLFLLAERVAKDAFIGTGAWYYLIINLCKVPFAAWLGLFPRTTLTMTPVLIPFVLLGTWLGRILARRINQVWFERITLLATAVSAVSLLIS